MRTLYADRCASPVYPIRPRLPLSTACYRRGDLPRDDVFRFQLRRYPGHELRGEPSTSGRTWSNLDDATYSRWPNRRLNRAHAGGIRQRHPSTHVGSGEPQVCVGEPFWSAASRISAVHGGPTSYPYRGPTTRINWDHSARRLMSAEPQAP